MGSLITDTPFSEIGATLEILDHLGVGREDLKKFRAAAPEVQQQVAHIFKCADSATRISVTSENTAPKKLLKLVTSVSLAAIESFESAKNFKVDKKSEVQIYWLGTSFKKHFGRKVERACEAVEIRVHTLKAPSLDAPIITELGEKREISLGQFFALLKKQGKGQKGALLTNGYANIAYVRDDEGVLRAVRAYWDAGYGWHVEAYALGHPGRWDSAQVLSR